MITDEVIDGMIRALIEEGRSGKGRESDIISYTDYMATLKRIYPNLVSYFTSFYIEGEICRVIANKTKKKQSYVEGQINKIRGFTVVYFYKIICGEKYDCSTCKANPSKR